MKQVVITEEIHPAGMALLQARPDINLVCLEGDAGALPAALTDAHGVLVRTMFLPEADLSRATQLQVVSRHGVGCDNIAVEHLSSRGIPMAIAVNANTTSVVEHVLMMMLALNKRAFEYDQLTRNHQFSERCKRPTSELCDKHILIVGFGRIGKRVAPVCRALGMRVTVADIALDEQYATALGCNAVSDFHTVLPDADYVTVHVPLNASTTHLIGKSELAALPAHAIVINCARGGIVDEDALAQALGDGSIAAAGCDVFTTEPPATTNPLLKLPNALLTPHNAASTAEGLERMATFAAQNLLDGLDGKLNPEMLFNRDQLA
ncbi:MAG: hydroxyacid dehydrogenase [Granulosicoccus sp.]|nr:hydroxyacid dehydrogenase [Granulosicoccus sp.]